MSTGFELVPLAIGGLFVGGRAIARAVHGAYAGAREEAEARDIALADACVTFETDMRDLDLARQALEASGLTPGPATDDGVAVDVDGHHVQIVVAEGGHLQLVAPLLMGEEAAARLAVDLDTEYRKLVQAQSYQRVLDHARQHGMAVAGETVEEDGSIVLTLDV